MTVTFRGANGESVQTTAPATSDAEGDEGAQFRTAWDRETTIKAGSWSLASYGKNHNASQQQAFISAANAIGGAIASAASSHYGCTFAFYATDATPAEQIWLLQMVMVTAKTGVGIYLTMKADGSLGVSDESGNILASSSTAAGYLTDSTWQYFRVTMDFDSTANSGNGSYRWRVWKWSTADPRSGQWVSAIDYTQNGSAIFVLTSTISQIYFQSSHGVPKSVVNPATHTYHDDMCQWTFTVEADLTTNALMAPAMVMALRPTALGSSGDFTTTNAGAGTGPLVASVNQTVADGDTTYDQNVAGDTATVRKQLYSLADMSPSPGAGYTLWVEAITNMAPSIANAGRGLYRENSTTNDFVVNDATAATYLSVGLAMMTATSDASAFTETRINTFETGGQKNALSNRTVKITETFLLVVGIPPLVKARIVEINQSVNRASTY